MCQQEGLTDTETGSEAKFSGLVAIGMPMKWEPHIVFDDGRIWSDRTSPDEPTMIRPLCETCTGEHEKIDWRGAGWVLSGDQVRNQSSREEDFSKN